MLQRGRLVGVLAALLLQTQLAGAQTVVTYSVGTETSDLKSSGVLTMDITAGVATFSEAQADRVGIGDEVTYNGITVGFLTGRVSSTVYTIATRTGTTPINVAGVTVNSIRRAFNLLSTAVTGSIDGSHLGGADLTALDVQLQWACYNDNDVPMNDVTSTSFGVLIDGYVTDVNRFIRVLTPVNTSEVGVSQRHRGEAGTGFRLAPVQPAPDSFFAALGIEDPHVRVEGIEIDGAGITNGEDVNLLFVFNFPTAGSDIRLSHSIVHGALNTTINDLDSSFAKGITIQDGNARISNNLVYDIDSVSTHSGSFAMGIELNEATATHFVHNNTVFDIQQSAVAGGAEAVGIADWSSVATARNNFVGDVVSATGPENCYRLIGTPSNNVSSDGTASGPGSRTGQSSYATYFVDTTPGSEDLHLRNDSSQLWMTVGMDLDSDPNLPVTDDVDGQLRNPSQPDIGADELGGCAPLSVTEGAGTITVTAPAQFELLFDDVRGGAIESFYDLATDPGRTLDLAGLNGSQRALFIDEVQVGGTNYKTGIASLGSHATVLEATPTRVKVREATRLTDNSGSGSLTGVRVTGDYSIYPSGRMAIDWQRDTAISVGYDGQQLQTNVHFETSGPLNTWAAFSQSGAMPPNRAAGDDFVFIRGNDVPNDLATDFLSVLYRDWPLATETNWNTNGAGRWAEASWFAAVSGTLPATESFDLLTYFKPTTLVDNVDPAVTTRAADYRTPSSIVVTTGAGWNENTADGDFFNESEAAYTFDADVANGLTFDMDGSGTVRYSPFIKVRQWRSLGGPSSVSLEGTPLTAGVGYLSDLKPISRAPYMSGALLQHVTLESSGSVSSPDVGSAGVADPSVSFVTGRFGNGMLSNAANESVTFPSAGNIDFARGAVEFWFLPNFDHDDGVRHRFWSYSFDFNNALFFEKHSTNDLRFGFRHGPLASDQGTAFVNSTNYSWNAGDWVHLRAEWDDSLGTGSRLRIFINGTEPTNSGPGNDYISGNMATGGSIILGVDSSGLNPMDGVLDAYRLYGGMTSPTELAFGGLASNADEYLGTASRDFTYNMTAVDGQARGNYAYFGSDSRFRGLNFGLTTKGVGDASLAWEYWNGSSWADLESVTGFLDETADLTGSGTVYWEADPGGWSVYSVNGGPDLYYVRVYVESGSYTTAPVEGLVTTDILLFQYCGAITAAAQTFAFGPPVPTAVDLVSFSGMPVEDGVRLDWETASEIDNLGFRVFRADDGSDVFGRITSTIVPGLGSSPAGARYTFVDRDVTAGASYRYRLEDVDTRGNTTAHDPIRVTMIANRPPSADPPGPIDDDDARNGRITYGRPEMNRFRILRHNARGATLELLTEGFHVELTEDGRSQVWIPGMSELWDEHAVFPVQRVQVPSVVGRRTTLRSVKARDRIRFSGLSEASGVELRLVADSSGVVRGRRRLAGRGRNARSTTPAQWAVVDGDVLQGDDKYAAVSLFPVRFDTDRGELVLTRRLRVRLSFREREPGEALDRDGRPRRRTRRPRAGDVLARLVTSAPGLYSVRFEDVLGAGSRRRPAELRLSRRGESVAYHLEPPQAPFGPGSRLFFVSGGGALNAFDDEAVYELSVGAAHRMPMDAARPRGALLDRFRHTARFEHDRLYQPGLLNADALWHWDSLLAPETKTFPFTLQGVDAASPSELRVFLHGISSLGVVDEHHIRASINGAAVGDVRFGGRNGETLVALVPGGTLVEGDNVLELTNVGDSSAAHSLVLMNAFELDVTRHVGSGVDGVFESDGHVALASPRGAPYVVFGEDDRPAWRYGYWHGERYVVSVEALRPVRVFDRVLRPAVRWPRPSSLTASGRRVDWIAIAPRAFADALEPLAAHRRKQGLRSRVVAVEDVWNAFGHGERSPDAVSAFLAHAYHEWDGLQYVVLVGDASYDPKDRLGTGRASTIPSNTVETSFLWTASDPLFAAVNGSDQVPDFAIGRLPASTTEDVTAMVDKILDYERGRGRGSVATVFVTDDSDGGGSFRRDAEALASTLAPASVRRRIHLEELGVSATRDAVRDLFDDGAGVVSYVGHGAIHLWANERLLASDDVESMLPPEHYPIVLTMNCLNGYFEFPYFDTLAEALVKADGKGAVAAFSPSGLSLNAPARQYHEALMVSLHSGRHARLGDAVLAAQRSYAASGSLPELLLLYHLFGDPALAIR